MFAEMKGERIETVTEKGRNVNNQMLFLNNYAKEFPNKFDHGGVRHTKGKKLGI